MVSRKEISKVMELDMMEFISNDDIPFRNHGRYLTMRCPFHDDRKPSMAIYPNGFYCFACGIRGSIIDWVMARFGVNFPRAVSELKKYGKKQNRQFNRGS